MITNLRFNTLAYYLSQYFWILYILIPLGISFLVPKRTNKVTILSSKAKFDISKDPVIFAHLSDTHINTFRPESIDSFHTTIEIIKSYNPEFIIHTGDIVDNYDSTKMPRYAVQNKDNWRVYKESTLTIDTIPIIEVAGNHDMFGVKNYNSLGNNILDYTHSMTRNGTQTEDNFLIRSFKVGPSQTNIIALNTYQFPFPHSPLIMDMPLSSRTLDQLETELRKSSTKSVIICHYPIGSIKSKSSSSGKTLTDIVDTKETVLAFLSGHWHPKKPNPFYNGKGGGVDIVGTASFQYKKFGIVTIDNDGVAWSSIDINKPPKGVISYPIPADQVSSNSIFNDIENSAIRVVTFSDENDLKIAFKITEKSSSKVVYDGFLNYSKRLVNGHSLYSFPMNRCIQKFGEYRIDFSGGFDGSTDFVVKESVISASKEIGHFTGLYSALPFIYTLFVVLLLIVTIFIPLNCFNFQTKLNEVEEWIETSSGGKKASYWIISIFCGFMLVRTRFLRLPLFLKIFCLVIVLCSILCPILFTEFEESLGFVWLFGYVVNNNFIVSKDGVAYSALYLAIVVTPIVLLCSSFGVYEWSIFQLFDFILFIIFIGLDVFVLVGFIYKCSGSNLTGTSISFVLIPSVFVLMFIVWLAALRNGTGCCNDDDDEDYANGYYKNVQDDLTQNLNTLPTQVII